MSRRMIACDEASFLISYKQDNRMGPVSWMRLKMHLFSCHLCRKYALQIDELDRAVTKYGVEASFEPCQHHLSETSCEQIKQAVEEGLHAS